jgi:hypothetical protein
MNTPASVMGCSSCGALYSPAPGDKGVCDDCRSLLPPDPSWRSGGASSSAPSPKPASAPGARSSPGSQPIGSISKRPGAFSAQRPNFRRSRLLRRVAIAAVCVAALGGGAAWLLTHERSLSDLQRAIKHQSPPEAWKAIERHASNAWVSLKKLWPFDGPQVKRSGPSAPASSHAAVRDATASHSTRRRAPPAQLASSSKKKRAKPPRDDLSAPGSSP